MVLRPLVALAVLLLGPAPDAKPAGPAADVSVKVRETASVGNADFTLGEIAEVTGTDRALVAQVAAMKLGASPLPGLSRPYFTGEIVTRLRYNRIDASRVAITAPRTIQLTRASNEIPVDEVVQAAADKLRAERARFNDGADVEPVQLPARGFAAPGKREEQATVARGTLETGPVTMQVTTLVDGRPVRTVEIPFRVRRKVMAVLAKRPLPPRTLIGAEDVTVAAVDASTVNGSPLTDPQAVLGLRTTRQLAQGAVLDERSVELAPVISSGGQVTLEIAVGGVTLSTAAVARASGAVGQTVRVTVTDTHRDVMAVVVDAKTVRSEEK